MNSEEVTNQSSDIENSKQSTCLNQVQAFPTQHL